MEEREMNQHEEHDEQAGKNEQDGKDAMEEIRKLAPKVPEQMKNLLISDKTPPIVKVRIIEIILNRTYGKADASVRLTTAHQSVEAAQIRIEDLFARAALEED